MEKNDNNCDVTKNCPVAPAPPKDPSTTKAVGNPETWNLSDIKAGHNSPIFDKCETQSA